MTWGPNQFISQPKWTIDSVVLSMEENVTCLGTILGNNSGRKRVDSRVTCGLSYYYSLQCAGMFKSGLAPKTAFHLYNAGVKSVLLFGSFNL